MRPSIRLLAMGIGLLGVGCGSSDPEVERRGGPLPPDMVDGGKGGAPSEPHVTWCEALRVLEAKCQRCHGDPPKNGAPMPLVTYEDTQATWSATQDVHHVMERAVSSDFMPYVELNEPPASLMPPVEPLDAEEKATLLAWLRAGAKAEGGTDCR